MYKNLRDKFRKLEGQPVRIFTDDERVIKGVVLHAEEFYVAILEKCGDVFIVEYPHIASYEIPMMRLRRSCCENGRDYDRDYDRDYEQNGEGNCNG